MWGQISVPWDRIADGINRRLPLWARYEGAGKAVWALTLFIFAAVVLVIAAYNIAVGATGIGAGLFVVAVVLASVGDYYRQAAKKRVRCNHCRALARGNDVCPQCGELTYVPAGENE